MRLSDYRGFRWLSNLLVIGMAVFLVDFALEMRAQNKAVRALLARESAAAGSPRAPEIGDPVESLTLEALDTARSMNLRELAGAQVTIVTVFTTTCPFCQRSLPTWAMLSDRVQDIGVEFLSVSLDEAPMINAYVQMHDIDWPVWIPVDPEDFIARMKVGVVPLTVVLSDNQIGAVYRGEFQPIHMETLLHDLAGNAR